MSDATTRIDPRVLRTRGLLQDALLALARERPLDEISVADVADRATVNRSTFYQHYADIDTLLADALDTRAARAGADLSDIKPGDAGHTDEPPAVLVHYFQHVAPNAGLYRRALGEGGSVVALTRLRARVTQLVLDAFDQFPPPPGTTERLPRPIAAAALAGSLIGVLVGWLELDPLPPAEDGARWAWLAATGQVLAEPSTDATAPTALTGPSAGPDRPDRTG